MRQATVEDVEAEGIELACGPDAPREARRYVTRTLDAPPDVIEAAELVTSELVTNTVKYGHAPLVRVAVAAAGGTVTITVCDTTPYDPLPKPALADEDQENGRGLFLVAALTSRWGHRPTLDGGTCVWAELAG